MLRILGTTTSAVVALCILFCSGSFCAGQTPSWVTGHWLTTMTLPDGSSLRMGLNIVQEAGALRATLDVPEQGAMNIPGEQVAFEQARVRARFPSIGAEFEGVLTGDRTLRGGLKQGGGTGPELEWTLSETALQGPPRPQEPQRPFPYVEKEVQIENPADGVRLSGTLTLPSSGGPFPAVFLISGSGPNDRDELIWGHRVFLVLADWLTRQGIAVLRADDRGTGKSSGDYGKSGLDEFVSDALAAVRFLKQQKEIDSSRIGLIGHSEGGVIAPEAAAQNSDISFVALLAGPVEPVSTAIDSQYRHTFTVLGASETAIGKYLDHQQRVYRILKEEKDLSVVERRFLSSVEELTTALTPEEVSQLRFDPAQERSGFAVITVPEFRSLVTREPRVALEALTCPVLALFGSKDLQVDAGRNMSLAKEAFAKAHNDRATVMCLEGMNHLFQTAPEVNDFHYERLTETISPVALGTVSDWIKKITSSK